MNRLKAKLRGKKHILVCRVNGLNVVVL